MHPYMLWLVVVRRGGYIAVEKSMIKGLSQPARLAQQLSAVRHVQVRLPADLFAVIDECLRQIQISTGRRPSKQELIQTAIILHCKRLKKINEAAA